MIQDIFPHKMNNQYDADATLAIEDIALSIIDGQILVREKEFEDKKLVFPKVGDFPKNVEYTYLFSIDEKRYYLVNSKDKDEGQLISQEDGEIRKNSIIIPEGYSYVKDRSIRTEGMGPDTDVFAAITAKHLADWYKDNKFCGRCGNKMEHSKRERAMKCPECGYTSYPRIMPAVIVGVINNDKLLITKYRTGFAHNALIAGFTEIGETVEETVAREVMEEAGVKVKNIRYYKSQPWGSANDILLGFYCELDGDDIITMDDSELKFAQWLKPEEIELQPGTFSLTNEMMRNFKEGTMPY